MCVISAYAAYIFVYQRLAQIITTKFYKEIKSICHPNAPVVIGMGKGKDPVQLFIAHLAF